MKKRPVKMGTGSFGRSNHVMAIVLNERMGNQFKVINFPGTAECVNALMRGDVEVGIATEVLSGVYGMVG